MSRQNEDTHQDVFRYPVPDSNSPTLATGQFALERRSSSRRGSPLARLANTRSPVSEHGANRVNSPSPLALGDGFRSTASSPGPSRLNTFVRRGPPPPLQVKRMRPLSELFLPTPISANKRMTFKLPDVVPEEPTSEVIQAKATSELLLQSPPDSAIDVNGIEKAGTVEEEEGMDVDEIDEPLSPDEPPLSPISSAISKARFSRLDVHSSIRHAINNINIITEHPAVFDTRQISTPVQMERPSTAPPTGLHRTLSSATIATMKTTRSAPFGARSIRISGSSSRGAGIKPMVSLFRRRGTTTRFSGVDKGVTTGKRLSSSSRRTTEIGPAEAAAQSPMSPGLPVQRKPTTSALPWRRKRKGETMSMLLDSGFFPVEEFIYKDEKEKQKEKEAKTQVKRKATTKKGRLALSILVNETSPRPSSIVGTPTEFYHRSLPQVSPRRHIRGSIRRSHYTGRRRVIGQPNSPTTQRESIIANALALSPLSPLASPTTPSTPISALIKLVGGMDSHITPSEISPGILEVIPEDGAAPESSMESKPIILEENDTVLITEEPIDIPPDVPVKTEIHLTSGTTITVTPPELTCWTYSIYIQGPIKLPTPAVALRKDSIATMAPFQDAVDVLYDNALLVSRRDSEDHVMDDLLDWYDAWAYGVPSYDFDIFDEPINHFFTHDSDYDSEPDSPGPMEHALATRMLSSSGLVPRKASAMLGLTADDIALPPISPTKARFSFSGSRKSLSDNSRRGSASSGKRGVGSFSHKRDNSLTTLPEHTVAHRPPTVFTALSSMRKYSADSRGSWSRKGSGYSTLSTLKEDVTPIFAPPQSFEFGFESADDENVGEEKENALSLNFYTPVETSDSRSPPLLPYQVYDYAPQEHNYTRHSSFSFEETSNLPHEPLQPPPSPPSSRSTVSPISVLPRPPSSASKKIIEWGDSSSDSLHLTNDSYKKPSLSSGFLGFGGDGGGGGREVKETAGWFNKKKEREKRKEKREDKERKKRVKREEQERRDREAMPKPLALRRVERANERVVVMF